MPTSAAMPKADATVVSDTSVGQSRIAVRDSAVTSPIATPIAPPIRLITIASTRNCNNTSRAAEVIKRTDLGHLGVGAEADIAVLNLRRGKFGFIDTQGGKLVGDQKLE